MKSPVPKPRIKNSPKDIIAIVFWAVLFALSLLWNWIEKSFPVRKKKQGKVIQMKSDYENTMDITESFYNQD